jgi:hypothetical protein
MFARKTTYIHEEKKISNTQAESGECNGIRDHPGVVENA